MLGVIIGSACIVLVVTVALAGKRYIISEIEGVGSNLVYGNLIGTGSEPAIDQVTPGDLQAMQQQIPAIVHVAGTHDLPMTISLSGHAKVINLVGVTEQFQQIRNLVILRGRYFDQDDMMTRSKVCLLTDHLAHLLFPDGNPVVQDLQLRELHFTVIGTFKERVATFEQSEIRQDSVLIPFMLIKDYVGADYFKTFYVQADTPEDVPQVQTQVGQLLRSRHRPGAQYDVESLTGILNAARDISAALTLLLVVIALIALVISGIGIMNIMLVTVTERTREIGIRKAIGAPRAAILYQFVLEAVMISGTGAFLGVLIGVAIPAFANFLLKFTSVAGDIKFPISWVSVVLAFVVSCSTGLVFGYIPANRAAKLHPTESLRYE